MTEAKRVLCSDCRYFHRPRGMPNEPAIEASFAQCLHPKSAYPTQKEPSRVNGWEGTQDYRRCEAMRSACLSIASGTAPCGPDGQLFEAKEMKDA